MTKAADLLSRIAALLDEGDIAPTPPNFEFWYRYVTGADPDLVQAVDAVRKTNGHVSLRSMAHIRRELYGRCEDDLDALDSLLGGAEAQLYKMADYVGRSASNADDYRQELTHNHKVLGSFDGTSVGTHRQMLEKMISTTSIMIEKTARLEAELAISGQEINTLKRDLESARTESRTDPLTGIANRKAVTSYLEAQAGRALADHKPLSLAFCDIDHFKLFNDTWGHRLGDEVLRLVGMSLERLCHGIGFPARYGGEEFVVVLPGKGREAARDIAEQLREFVASRTVRAKQSNREVGRITLSLGVAELRPDDTIEALIERADQALYQAKKNGRNRVCSELDLPTTRKVA